MKYKASIWIALLAMIMTATIFLKNQIMLRPQVTHGATPVFRFHIRTDLDSMDPARSKNSLISYLMNALHGPLLSYHKRKMSSFGASRCEHTKPLLVTCYLREDWFWSDQQPVTADQIVYAYSRLKEMRSPRLDALRTISEIKAIDTKTLQIRLSEQDADILYRLLDPALSPARADIDMNSGRVTTGPFFLHQHERGRSLYLKPNLFFRKKSGVENLNIDVEIMIIDSDEVALRLFQAGQLNLLRRLTADMIPEYKNHPGFFQVPFYRIDYIGFGPALLDHPQLRRDLAVSLNPEYDEFVRLFDALGRPGCFGLGRFAQELLEEGETHHKFDICFEKSKIKKYSPKDKSRVPKLTLNYSTLGDEDLRRSMEFIQYGWKKHLDLQVEVSAIEQGVLQSLLENSPPPLFRRGVSLERPTCLAALEVFESQSPNNFIRLRDAEYDELVARMRRETSTANLRESCLQGLARLIQSYRMIPLGAIHYTMLTDQKFDNFFINELGQIDLSALRVNAGNSENSAAKSQ